MKIQGVNAITIGIWAVILIALLLILGFGPMFFGMMLVIGLVWRFVEKKRKMQSQTQETPPTFS